MILEYSSSQNNSTSMSLVPSYGIPCTACVGLTGFTTIFSLIPATKRQVYKQLFPPKLHLH
jgi:hypothetical protein